VSAGWGRVGSRQVLTRQVRIPRAKCETLARRVNHAMLVLGKSDVIGGSRLRRPSAAVPRPVPAWDTGSRGEFPPIARNTARACDFGTSRR